MVQLTPLELEDGTVIYIEAREDIETSLLENFGNEEQKPVKRGAGNQVIQSFDILKETIRAYTHYTLNAFQQVAIANVNKVTLEFGINLQAKAGIPYITTGTATSNLKITVECSFPNQQDKVP
jgi:CRISPR/Cas system CMR subunit Cmr6 (Cas7 group RAMP superfamily)